MGDRGIERQRERNNLQLKVKRETERKSDRLPQRERGSKYFKHPERYNSQESEREKKVSRIRI